MALIKKSSKEIKEIEKKLLTTEMIDDEQTDVLGDLAVYVNDAADAAVDVTGLLLAIRKKVAKFLKDIKDF